jgi:hypothetical protein
VSHLPSPWVWKNVCIRFCAEFEKTEAESYEMVKTAFQGEAISYTQVFEWFHHLKMGAHPDLRHKVTSSLDILHQAEMMQ